MTQNNDRKKKKTKRTQNEGRVKRPLGKLAMQDQTIRALERCIEETKPESGSNPLAIPPRKSSDKNTSHSLTGVRKFTHLPLSPETQKALRECKYKEMTAIQRATIPHAMSGRDVLGAAKTGSGKTLSYVVPSLERLYRMK
jgi:ATP-dependent RNA helicase DDX10/DBP4